MPLDRKTEQEHTECNEKEKKERLERKIASGNVLNIVCTQNVDYVGYAMPTNMLHTRETEFQTASHDKREKC